MEPPPEETPAAEDVVVCENAEAEDYSHQIDEVSSKVEKVPPPPPQIYENWKVWILFKTEK